jgi:hypothetical protein
VGCATVQRVCTAARIAVYLSKISIFTVFYDIKLFIAPLVGAVNMAFDVGSPRRALNSSQIAFG